MSRGVNHIDKYDFLPLFQQTRTESLHQNNIRNGFAAIDLVLFDPDRVLSVLHEQYHTPSPQLYLFTLPTWTTETSHDIEELEQQTQLIKQYLNLHTQSPPSPIEQALN